MLNRMGNQLWDWMTDEDPLYQVPSVVTVTVTVFFVLVMAASWSSASYQIGVIELTRANGEEACRSPEMLRAYQSRASKQNDTILSWRPIRHSSFMGPVLVSQLWDDVDYIAIPGGACPAPS